MLWGEINFKMSRAHFSPTLPGVVLCCFSFAHSLAVYCLGDEIDKQNTVSRWLDRRTESTHEVVDAEGEDMETIPFYSIEW